MREIYKQNADFYYNIYTDGSLNKERGLMGIGCVIVPSNEKPPITLSQELSMEYELTSHDEMILTAEIMAVIEALQSITDKSSINLFLDNRSVATIVDTHMKGLPRRLRTDFNTPHVNRIVDALENALKTHDIASIKLINKEARGLTQEDRDYAAQAHNAAVRGSGAQKVRFGGKSNLGELEQGNGDTPIQWPPKVKGDGWDPS